MIRTLNLKELKQIYDDYIQSDFPPAERRPWFLIRKLHRKKQYVGIILEEDGKLLAYATFMRSPQVESVFLDYFAVLSEKRGTGIGSRFFDMFRSYWDTSGIIFECESPATAIDADEKQLRQKRIAFYERNGATLTNYHWYAFSIDYQILYLPINKKADEVDIGRDLITLYRLSIPSFLLKRMTKLTVS